MLSASGIDKKTELGVTCEYGGNDTFDRDVWHG